MRKENEIRILRGRTMVTFYFNANNDDGAITYQTLQLKFVTDFLTK